MIEAVVGLCGEGAHRVEPVVPQLPDKVCSPERMRYKTLFRLLLVVVGICMLMHGVGFFIEASVRYSTNPGDLI